MLAIVAVAVLSAGCASPGVLAQMQGQAQSPPPDDGVIPVEVATVETGSMAKVMEYSGSLQPQRSVSILPRVGGQIQSILVQAGDTVRAGDPIAVIDSEAYQLQLDQAQIGLDLARLRLAKMKQGTRPEQLLAARSAADIARAALRDAKNPDENARTVAAANLAQAEAAVRLAQYQYDKISWAGQAGMTKEALQLQQATTAYEQAKAAYDMQMNPSDSRLAAVEGQVVQADLNLALAEHPIEQVDFDMADLGVKQAEAAVKQAQLQVNYAMVRAPFAGIVSETYVHPGSMVGTQVPVASLISPETEIALNVEERQIGEVRVGQEAVTSVAAFPGRPFPGTVTSVAPAADARTHTFTVKVTPAEQSGMLRSGMYATVSILALERMKTILIPQSAMIDDGVAQRAYVVVDGKAVSRALVTGLTDNEHVEVLSGLSPGERVVTKGQPSLSDGAPVKVAGE